jgi:hypothetical protein
MELNFKDRLTLVLWFLLEPLQYREYKFWLSVGLVPKYAVEVVIKKNQHGGD